MDTAMIEGADHMYAGRTGELAATMADWIEAAI
jgi:alpha/beta superfamily hydrolase